MSSTFELVDMHCHLDLYPDVATVIAEIESQRIHTIAVTNAPSVFWHTEELARKSQYIQPALGLHPELAASRYGELDQFLDLLDRASIVGEIGLDGSAGGEAEYGRQREVFTEVLARCAVKKDKIISVHSRRAATDTISIIGSGFPGRVVLHWFSGSARELKRAIDYGFFFSVNSAMFRSSKGASLISGMPRERVLTETDGPFVRVGRSPATPAHVRDAIAGLAKLWRVTEQEASGVVFQNYRRITHQKLESGEGNADGTA